MDATARAQHAKQIMDDELVKEALATMRDEFTKALVNCPLRDADGALHLRIMLKLLGQFETFFAAVIEDGVMHQHQLQAMQRGRI